MASGRKFCVVVISFLSLVSIISVFIVGHIPFVLLECQLAQHGVVECGLVCVKRERGVWCGVGGRGKVEWEGLRACLVPSVFLRMSSVCGQGRVWGGGS